MKQTKLIQFVQSFILLPALTMSGAPMVNNMGPVSQAVINIMNTTPSVVFLQKQNEALALSDAELQELQAQKLKAEAIDAYFEKYDMPLQGMGMKMVLEAEKNDLDWRLLAAISIRESTGGKFACKTKGFNSFGWGSCKIGFSSNDEAIETIARNLGGNDPKTDHHYAGKNTKEILRKYNPPSIVPRYAEQVMSIMNAIGSADIVLTPTPVTT